MAEGGVLDEARAALPEPATAERGPGTAPGAGRPGPYPLLALWTVTRVALLLSVFGVLVLPGPHVTSDVSVIYRGWFEVLRTGTFPLGDVTWQYPPAAALAVLAPGLLPFLDYASAFYVLGFAVDTAVLALLLRAGRGPSRSRAGAWLWVVGVALLGPTAYARYDLMVTAVAVAALLAGKRRPRVAGALAALGALLKVWPVLLLAGVPRGHRTRVVWGVAGATMLSLTALFAAAMPGALAFVTFQRDRGTEVESLGALVFHVARHTGWEGRVRFHYGSVEFVGPYVEWVSRVSLGLTVLAFGWLLLWRLRARHWSPSTVHDAAFTAVLLFTTTSRVISPQYMLWLVGLGAVCLTRPTTCQRRPIAVVLAATAATLLEFPFFFSSVTASEPLGIVLLVVRNGLLVAACLLACRRLWVSTVAPSRGGPEASPEAHREPSASVIG